MNKFNECWACANRGKDCENCEPSNFVKLETKVDISKLATSSDIQTNKSQQVPTGEEKIVDIVKGNTQLPNCEHQCDCQECYFTGTRCKALPMHDDWCSYTILAGKCPKGYKPRTTGARSREDEGDGDV